MKEPSRQEPAPVPRSSGRKAVLIGLAAFALVAAVLWTLLRHGSPTGAPMPPPAPSAYGSVH